MNNEGKIKDFIIESNNGLQVYNRKRERALNHIREDLDKFNKKGCEITYYDLPFEHKQILAAWDVTKEEFEKRFRKYLRKNK